MGEWRFMGSPNAPKDGRLQCPSCNAIFNASSWKCVQRNFGTFSTQEFSNVPDGHLSSLVPQRTSCVALFPLYAKLPSGHVQRAAYSQPYSYGSWPSPVACRPLCGEPLGGRLTASGHTVERAYGRQ